MQSHSAESIEANFRKDDLFHPVDLNSNEVESQFLEKVRSLDLNARKPKLLMRSSWAPAVVNGVVVVVDFPDGSGDGTTLLQKLCIHLSSVHDKLFKDTWNPLARQTSVKSYFQHVSNGKLDINCNIVMKAVLLDKPKEHYDDPTKTISDVSRQFVTDVLSKLLEDNEELAQMRQPVLDAATLEDGNAISLNIIYAGQTSSSWNKGLWPHSYNLSQPIKFTKSDGTECYFKNYSVFGTTSGVSTICHELGHQVCKFPDLYQSVNGTSVSYGVGRSCLMGSSSVYVQDINPYFKLVQGWIQPIDLASFSSSRIIDLPCDGKTVYLYKKSSSEFFLIQHSEKSSIGSLDEIVIWRVNTTYTNTSSRVVGIGNDKHARGLLVQIVEPDGSYSLHGSGIEGTGLMRGFHSNDSFNDMSCPTSRWYDGSESKLKLFNFRVSSDGKHARFAVVPERCSENGIKKFADESQVRASVGSLRAGIDYDLTIENGIATAHGKGSYCGSTSTSISLDPRN